MSAICGCGRAVEAKKTFEKINYSNSSERKLRTILGTIRTQLRDNVALTKVNNFPIDLHIIKIDHRSE